MAMTMGTGTMEISLVDKPYEWLRASKGARFNILYGGASSSKSWTLSAYLLFDKLFTLPNVGIVALRRTRPSVKLSCWRLCTDWLQRIGYKCNMNKTDLIINSPNGSFIQFGGMDDVEKLKSLERVNYIWIEEATEITQKELIQLSLRCRAANPYEANQLFMSFNPVDPVGNAWLEAITKMAPEGKFLGSRCRVLMLTHLDNPMLPEEEHRAIEALADTDEEYNKIYRLGQWATPTHIIYTNWDIVPEFPNEYDLDDIGYGLDFGYVDPTALIKIGIKENDVYIQEELYDTNLHNIDLIGCLNKIIPSNHRDRVIMADSARPEFIDEIHSAGFNCHGVEKKAGDKKGFVLTGIDRCKRVRIHITQDSPNVSNEIRGYKRKVDRKDNVLEEPVKFKDHAMDAMRYFVYTFFQGQEEAETFIVQVPGWFGR